MEPTRPLKRRPAGPVPQIQKSEAQSSRQRLQLASQPLSFGAAINAPFFEAQPQAQPVSGAAGRAWSNPGFSQPRPAGSRYPSLSHFNGSSPNSKMVGGHRGPKMSVPGLRAKSENQASGSDSSLSARAEIFGSKAGSSAGNSKRVVLAKLGPRAAPIMSGPGETPLKAISDWSKESWSGQNDIRHLQGARACRERFSLNSC